MKKKLLSLLSIMSLAALVSVQAANTPETKEPWPGVTRKVLVDNEHVNVSEVTFAPGAVATWHSHHSYTAYAVTDVKMQVEIKGSETTVAELKAGQAIWSPAVTHQTSNVGKKPFTLIVTETK